MNLADMDRIFIESDLRSNVSVQLSRLHQAQFAGLYAGEQQGYYADEGLDVSFVEGGPEVDFISPVADRRAQFAMAQPADLILARAAGKPVRAITVIFHRSPVVFIALADSGIRPVRRTLLRRRSVQQSHSTRPCGP